jgi:hypothetical protein
MDAELAIHEGAGTPRRLLMYVIAVVFCQQQLSEFSYGKRFFKVKALQFIAGMQSQIFRLFLGCQQTHATSGNGICGSAARLNLR